MGLLDVREDGIFAGQPWQAGLEVMALEGRLRRSSELGLQDTHVLQVGESTYLDMTGTAGERLVHACDPTCGVLLLPDRMLLVALRAIAEGEQFTIDYATTSTENHYTWSQACGCGAARCRGRISGFGTLPVAVRARYVAAGVVPAYVLAAVSA